MKNIGVITAYDTVRNLTIKSLTSANCLDIKSPSINAGSTASLFPIAAKNINITNSRKTYLISGSMTLFLSFSWLKI